MRLTPESAGLWLLLPCTRSSILFSFQHVPAQWWLTLLLGFGFDVLLSFTLSFQWFSFYESILWYLTILIGFLFQIDSVGPNSSSFCAKELKGLGFPHWPPRTPHPPYSCLSLQMVELSVYLTEHCRATHPSTGYLVKQLQLHLGNRILMDLPVPLPAWALWESSVKLPSPHFSPLFGPNWYSWKDRFALNFSHAPRKRRERQTISFSPPPSLSSSAAGRSGAFLAYTHWLHVLNLCQWSGLIWSVTSHNPNMWSNIFLLDVFHPEAFPVLVKSCNGV